eukprot:GDKJ01058606.1.p1 GENE.GDKJ01058606.1~~GDKJ01058606.1.p1  ORF type:complete len:655 (+),score=162.81 GDKJ01058606.1:25-1989(+)
MGNYCCGVRDSQTDYYALYAKATSNRDILTIVKLLCCPHPVALSSDPVHCWARNPSTIGGAFILFLLSYLDVSDICDEDRLDIVNAIVAQRGVEILLDVVSGKFNPEEHELAIALLETLASTNSTAVMDKLLSLKPLKLLQPFLQSKNFEMRTSLVVFFNAVLISTPISIRMNYFNDGTIRALIRCIPIRELLIQMKAPRSTVIPAVFLPFDAPFDPVAFYSVKLTSNNDNESANQVNNLNSNNQMKSSPASGNPNEVSPQQHFNAMYNSPNTFQNNNNNNNKNSSNNNHTLPQSPPRHSSRSRAPSRYSSRSNPAQNQSSTPVKQQQQQYQNTNEAPYCSNNNHNNYDNNNNLTPDSPYQQNNQSTPIDIAHDVLYTLFDFSHQQIIHDNTLHSIKVPHIVRQLSAPSLHLLDLLDILSNQTVDHSVAEIAHELSLLLRETEGWSVMELSEYKSLKMTSLEPLHDEKDADSVVSPSMSPLLDSSEIVKPKLHSDSNHTFHNNHQENFDNKSQKNHKDNSKMNNLIPTDNESDKKLLSLNKNSNSLVEDLLFANTQDDFASVAQIEPCAPNQLEPSAKQIIDVLDTPPVQELDENPAFHSVDQKQSSRGASSVTEASIWKEEVYQTALPSQANAIDQESANNHKMLKYVTANDF